MRSSKKTIGRAVFAVAMTAVCVIGINATSTSAVAKPPFGGGGGPIYCLDVWKPVICPNGLIYSNDCYALRAGQTGCIPWGGYTS